MSRRKITRQVVETHGVRRSPRLSSRYMRSREVGEPGLTPFPLASVAYTATSRQSLGSYKAFDEQTMSNILDESGQSVPPSFEEDEGFAAVQSTGADPGADTLRHEYISAATAQHLEEESGMPQHLYGLDDSDDDESNHSGVAESEPRVYHHYSKERVLTPPKDGKPFTPSGFSWRVVAFFLGILYKLGSLFYLAATAILCLDVMILHRLFNTFHSMAGGMEGRPTLSWHRFWILPVTLCALVIFLIGGGLFPESTVVEPLPPDLVELRAQILRSITTSMQKEMSTFQSSFTSEMENYSEKHIEKAILASEMKLETLLKDHISTETEQRQVALKQLQQSIWKELNSTLETHQLSLRSSFEDQLSSLRQFVLEQVESGLTEAMVIEVVRIKLMEQLSAAKKEWIAEADKKFMADIDISTTSLKEDLLIFFNTKYEDYSNQLLDFQSKIDWSSLVTQVRELEAKLQATSSDVSTLKLSANRHEETLQHTLSETVIIVTKLKQSFLDLSRTLEEKKDGASSKAVILSIFNEEMDKVIKERLIQGSGLTRKEVEKLINDTLARYSADRIAKFDFALEDAGGSVVTSQCSKTYTPTLATVSLFSIPLWHVSTSPKAIIQPQVYPGDCWAFEGSKGHALVRLKDEIVITGVTLEHIPRELTPNGSLSTAPYNFTVWGKNSCENEEADWLGDFAYDEDGPPIQEYTVKVLNQAQPKTYSYVLFEFCSNHGSEHYTCVYRVRVHGHYLQEKW